MKGNPNPFCIISIGDVSFDWLWFPVSKEDPNATNPGSLAWEKGGSMEAAAMHGGAWLLEAFAIGLLQASSKARLKTKARELVYSYQRLETHALRAGHSDNFVHSTTHFDLFPLPSDPKKSTYRIDKPSSFFGPRGANQKSGSSNNLHLPKLTGRDNYPSAYKKYF